MTTHLLSRKPMRPGPALSLHPDISLPLGRLHEACGPGRYSFALWLAGQMQGPVLWIAPDWHQDRLNPDGMMPFVDPARFLYAHTRRPEDLLWCIEESLRSGAAPLVIADLPAPPALTPVRRMHLAAESVPTGTTPPLGLLLLPADGGARGVETRWYMAPAHTPDLRRWHLERRRARTAPPRAWTATQTAPRTGLTLTPTPLR